jgi:hypothetical protein
LAAPSLDALFERTAEQQYTRELLFSSCVSVVKAALRAEHGHETIEEKVSGYYLANEITRTRDGI